MKQLRCLSLGHIITVINGVKVLIRVALNVEAFAFDNHFFPVYRNSETHACMFSECVTVKTMHVSCFSFLRENNKDDT